MKGSGTSEGGYDNSRERAVLRLSEATHSQLRSFSVPGCNEEARLRGIESIARAVADFASIVEQQPVQFALLWKANDAPSSVGVGISPQLMDTALHIERDNGREPKVRGIVFPGLRKQVGQNITFYFILVSLFVYV